MSDLFWNGSDVLTPAGRVIESNITLDQAINSFPETWITIVKVD